MKTICTLSGGKDSQAVAIFLKNQHIDCEYVFCDTVWEDVVTYDFIKSFMDKMKKQLITIKNQKYENGMIDMVKHKKRFPSTKARFCTDELKVKPMIDYILSQECDVLIYQGIRHEESTNRAGMEKHDEYFKYYFEPYKIDEKTGKKKYYTYRKKDIVKWLEKYTCDVIRPIITWSEQQVFEYILDNGFMPNILYQYGFKRVGCFPCIMCTKDEIAKISEIRPEKIDEIEQYEKQLDSTFFPPEYIPTRFCKRKDWVEKTQKDGTIKKVLVGIPSVREVVLYVRQKGYGSGLFSGSYCQNQMLPCE